MIIVTTTQPPVNPPVDPPVVISDYGFALELITPSVIWDLASGPVYALAGASGFGAPDVEQWWRAAPSVNGSIYQGYRVPMREISLPIEIRETTPDKWLETDRAFWNSLDPRALSHLRLTMPDATTRYLPVRLKEGGSPELEIDPMLERHSLYELSLSAGDPFWRGEHVAVIYTTDAPIDLFPGPPFAINSTHTVTTGSVTNPGDEPAWPRWVIEGPYTEATVGVGASLVTLSTPIPLGQSRIVDMDPNVRSITDGNGVDKWLEATAAEFEAIPSGTDIPLSLAIIGETSDTHIELHFDARYRRAW